MGARGRGPGELSNRKGWAEKIQEFNPPTRRQSRYTEKLPIHNNGITDRARIRRRPDLN